ncbi:hypothetical protein D3C78_1930950 [compost metagenome]
MAIIRIEKLNGTAKRCNAPYSDTSRTSNAITTVKPLMAIAPDESLIAAISAFVLLLSTDSN